MLEYTPRQAAAWAKWAGVIQRSEDRTDLAIARGNEKTLDDMQDRWKKADWKDLEG